MSTAPRAPTSSSRAACNRASRWLQTDKRNYRTRAESFRILLPIWWQHGRPKRLAAHPHSRAILTQAHSATAVALTLIRPQAVTAARVQQERAAQVVTTREPAVHQMPQVPTRVELAGIIIGPLQQELSNRCALQQHTLISESESSGISGRVR